MERVENPSFLGEPDGHPLEWDRTAVFVRAEEGKDRIDLRLHQERNFC